MSATAAATIPKRWPCSYKGKTIADVLTMRVSEALELFGNIPKIRQVLQTLADVGLDYLSLGQPAPTLSGGEAQRVKLAAELAGPTPARRVYILDEPTTGLHFDDIRKLLDVLNRLVDLGNTVIVVEHNLDVIKTADWIIDLGPEAGDAGGTVVAEGTPEMSRAMASLPPLTREAALTFSYRPIRRPDVGRRTVRRSGPSTIRSLPRKPGWRRAAGRSRQGRRHALADRRPSWHTKDRISSDGKPAAGTATS